MARHPAGRGRARPRAPRGAGQPGADGSGAARRAAAYAAAPRGWWEGRLLTRYLDYLALPLNLVTLCCKSLPAFFFANVARFMEPTPPYTYGLGFF